MDDVKSQRPALLLWGIVALLVIALFAVAAYRAWPLLFPEIIQLAPLDPECDLRQGACSASFGEGRTLRFALQPQHIPMLQPLTLEVEVAQLQPHRVEVDFAGVAMNMGFNRPQLHLQQEGRFAGKGTLPVCVLSQMEWEARVLLYTDQGILAAPFRFITYR